MRIKFLLSLLLCVSLGYYANAQCSINSSPGNTCTWGDQIDALKINGISSSNSTGCSSGGYGGVFNSNWVFKPGGSYSFDITCGGGVYDEGVAIWIDLDQNGYYDNSEMIWASSGTGRNFSGTLSIPSSATKGTTRLRIRCAWINTISSGQACTPGIGYGYGETEDYNIVICEPPTVVTQPSNSFACENGKGQITLDATGADAYQWQTDNGTGWQNVTNNSIFSGANTDTLKLDNTPTTMNTNKFRCIIGACSNALKDTSQEITLDVYANTKIEQQTYTDTSCVGLNTKFFVKSAGVIVGYRWQIYDNTLGDYVDVSLPQFAANNDTLTVVKSQDTLNGAKLRCIVTGLCGIDTSSNIDMTVQALPAVTTDPKDVTLDQGYHANFDITSAGVGVKYQWQVGINNVFSNVNEGGIYKGVKRDRLQVRNVAFAQTGYQFRCIVKGAGSCATEPDTSEIGVLYVNVPNSVNSIASEAGINMYPNPTNGQNVVIEIENNSNISSYTIVDKLGRIVANGNINGTKTTVNVENLSTGIYTVQLKDNQNQINSVLQLTKM